MDPDWRPVKAVEVSGPAGGAVQVHHNDAVVEGLAARVRAVKERREQEAARRAAEAAGVAEGAAEPRRPLADG